MDEGWHAVSTLRELPEQRGVRVELDGQDVLLVRKGEVVFAIANRCSHQGAPLHRGPVRFSGSLRTVRCPVHGSEFELDDGRVLRGPAIRPVAAFDTRVSDGVVEIRQRR